MAPYFLSALIGYLLGSIPTAYLFMRRLHRKDIRNEGSGNVGALNAFEVSRSASTGALVLAIDLFKGLAAMAIAAWWADGSEWGGMAAGVAVVAGHNFSPWIGFKGGRGLATAAGVALWALPLLLPVWGVFWGAAYLLRRDIHVGNIAASLLTPAFFLALLFLPGGGAGQAFFRVHLPAAASILVGGVFSLILAKHIEPVMSLLRQRSQYGKTVSE